jgi:hypothetical protein
VCRAAFLLRPPGKAINHHKERNRNETGCLHRHHRQDRCRPGGWREALAHAQIDNIQKQIDFVTDKFTNADLYDWMVSSLSGIYFQNYRLAYKLCKQLERCYPFELGVPDSSFIQFGYWDSLRKGLLAGEALSHDLRRMQASYLAQSKSSYHQVPSK